MLAARWMPRLARPEGFDMPRCVARLILSLAVLVAPLAHAADNWVEGRHYFRLEPVRQISTPPGTVEVIEVFSYACPACDAFRPLLDGLRASLPPQVRVVYVPASFNAAEDWPTFQRGYFAAQRLGIAEKTHTAMFAAIWKSGELAVVDEQSHRVKSPAPTIEDIAAFYARTAGVKATQFVEVAKSFAVDRDMRGADDLVKSCRVDSTPTLLINGKYRADASSAGGFQQLVELARWLIAREVR
jgi:thiol:disulfide interchange protein DsbA